MPVYLIVETKEVIDKQKYGEYIQKVPRTIDKFGGKYLARGGQVTVFSGDWKPVRLIIVEFESLDKFKARGILLSIGQLRRYANSQQKRMLLWWKGFKRSNWAG